MTAAPMPILPATRQLRGQMVRSRSHNSRNVDAVEDSHRDWELRILRTVPGVAASQSTSRSKVILSSTLSPADPLLSTRNGRVILLMRSGRPLGPTKAGISLSCMNSVVPPGFDPTPWTIPVTSRYKLTAWLDSEFQGAFRSAKIAGHDGITMEPHSEYKDRGVFVI